MRNANVSMRLRTAASAAVMMALAFPASAEDAAAAIRAVEAVEQDVPVRPNINPYDRDIGMTVPLNFNRRVLGELDVLLTRDDRFVVYSAGFLALLNPLLTPDAQAELKQVIGDRTEFLPEDIEQSGIRLEYDPAQLAVLVLRIDPNKRAVEGLFQQGRPEAHEAEPEAMSAYLNTSLGLVKRYGEDKIQKPNLYLNGAVRMAGVVLEGDFQGQETLGSDKYEFTRRYARFVYDDPENFRRWWVGDLDPEVRGRQSYVQMGGIGVARQRQRFESFRNGVLAGNRQMVLQEGSTVRLLRNGLFVREFQLDAGQYDLSNLPLETGSNDIQLEIRDALGRTSTLNYTAYLDAIDLDPGDYEYGAFFGRTTGSMFGSPDYSDGKTAFTGYWRKAFEDRPALGLGFQAGKDVQTFTGQTQIIIANGGRLRFDAALSNADDYGQGYSLAVGFDHFVDRGEVFDSWAIAAEYIDDDFASLGNPQAQNPTEWNLQAAYTRRFTENWMGSVSSSYRVSRNPQIADSYTVNAYTTYNFNPTIGVQVGAEYSDYGQSMSGGRQGFGLTLALIWTPRFDRRAEARYATHRDSGSVRFQQSGENRVGALGYSLASTYDDGPASLSGQVDYVGNRFDAAFTHTSFGSDFQNITDQQVSSLTVGSSIAFTGGKVGVGRRIFDSFAIVDKHESLGNRRVIVGDTLQAGRYNSSSGPLGPAMANYLSSYVNQSVQYDVVDVPLGYDIGDGIKRVRPAYRSGYVIEAGSAAFVSAMGRLHGHGGLPASLLSGRVYSVNEPNAPSEVFFTNSVGRFAIQKLTPGHTYRVELYTSPVQGFEFKVPEDNEGLLDLQTVTLPIFVSEP